MRTTSHKLLPLLLAAGLAAPAIAQPDGTPPRVPNVLTQFNRLEKFGDWMGFYLGSAPDPTVSDHWQGLQRHTNPNVGVFYLTRSGNDQSDNLTNLAVVKMASRDTLTGERLRSNRLKKNAETQDTAPLSGDAIVLNIPFPTHQHAGGTQISGDILAVPLEDPVGTNPQGEIVFFDVSQPLNPVRLPFSITNTIHNFGVVGFTRLPDGRYFLLATWGDNSQLEYFLSSGTTLDSLPATPSGSISGSSISGWPISGALGIGYCYQTINFITQADGQLFLACTYNTASTAPIINGLDLGELYRVSFSGTTPSFSKLSTRHFHCSSNSSGSNGNFNAAAGYYVSPAGELLLYSTTHDNDGPSSSTGMSEFRNYYGNRNATPRTPCDAWVRLYADPTGWESDDRGFTIDAVDRALDDYQDFNLLDGGPIPVGFTDQASSVSWLLPVGVTARLWQNDSFGGSYLDLVGTGTTAFIADLGNVSWTSGSGNPNNKISSVSFLGNAPAPTIRVPSLALNLTFANAIVLPGPCAQIVIEAGSYPENVLLNRATTIRSSGGNVIIGTNP